MNIDFYYKYPLMYIMAPKKDNGVNKFTFTTNSGILRNAANISIKAIQRTFRYLDVLQGYPGIL